MRTRVIDTTTGGLDLDSVKRLKAAGVGIALLYFYAGGDWKHGHADDVKLLRDGGIDIGAICEPGDGDIHDDNGAALAKGMRAAIAAVGGPRDPFVWFGEDVDTPASLVPAVMRVLDSAAAVLGKDKVGVYGSGLVCRAAIVRGYKGWECQSTGYSGRIPRAQAEAAGLSLFQLMGAPYGDLGMDYDGNDMLADDVGQWGYKPAPPKFYVHVRATRRNPWGRLSLLVRVFPAAIRGQRAPRAVQVWRAAIRHLVTKGPIAEYKFGPFPTRDEAKGSIFGAKRGWHTEGVAMPEKNVWIAEG